MSKIDAQKTNYFTENKKKIIEIIISRKERRIEIEPIML